MNDLMKLTAKCVGGKTYYDLHGSIDFVMQLMAHMIPDLLQEVAAVADRETEERVHDEICRRLLKIADAGDMQDAMAQVVGEWIAEYIFGGEK